ncbi:TetR/AcrR family transcriptional regulator [Chakrabartia godavariana]|nr:TetR/AcrR family transcriptional regulator [Chakrabartia godavariana]
METSRTFRPTPVTARDKLLEAAVKLIRSQGFAGTSVDQLCAEAGVTKGAFFHHFPSKDALGVAAADYWSSSTGSFFDDAPYHAFDDPLDRVLGYIDFRLMLLNGAPQEFSCVAGTMVQEAFLSSPAIRDACRASIDGNAAKVERDIADAMELYGVTGFSAAGLSLHIQAVLQGSFVLAKAHQGPEIARENVAHLKRYFEMLFNRDV